MGRGLRFAAVLAVVGSLLVVPGPAAVATVVEWLDPTFGSGGATVVPDEGLGSTMSEPDALGRIYVATKRASGLDDFWRLRRVLPDGSVDPTFSVAEMSAGGSPESENYWIMSVAADVGGTVTVMATTATGVTFYRFTGTGAPDPAYGTNGVLEVPITPEHFFANVVVRPGGGYLAYSSVRAPDTDDNRYVVVAVTDAGALDPSWAPTAPTPGKLELPTVSGTPGDWLVLVARPGGGYVGSTHERGPTVSPDDNRQFLVGLTEAGGLDLTWAASGPTPGVLETEFQVGELRPDGPSVLALGADVLLRLSTTGVPDPTFGPGGRCRSPTGSSSSTT